MACRKPLQPRPPVSLPVGPFHQEQSEVQRGVRGERRGWSVLTGGLER